MSNIVQMHTSKLQYNKAMSALRWLDRRFALEDIGVHETLLANLLSDFKHIFTNLRQPLFNPRYLSFYPNSAEFNENLFGISSDVNTLFDEIDTVEELLAHQFNYTDVGVRRIVNEVQETQSLISRLQSLVRSDDILVGQDSFNSPLIMDTSKLSGSYEAADIIPEEGILTLKRTENISVLTSAEVSWKTTTPNVSSTDIELAKDRFNKDYTKNPPDRNIGLGIYEGMYYGKRDEWRPEGGTWHITSTSVDVTAAIKTKQKLQISHVPIPALEEQGGNSAELQTIRQKMFDNNPDTFWEVEMLEDRFEPLSVNGKVITESMIANADVDTSTKNAIRLQEGKEIKSNTRFTGELTFKLASPQVINWISLKPHNFGQPTRLIVKSISTLSTDSTSDSDWKKLDDFVNNKSDMILTDKSMQELNREEIFATLSANKNSQLGAGVWTFSPRKVQQIKFVLEQDTPYAPQYEVIAMSVAVKKGDDAGQQGFSITVPVEGGATVPVYVKVDPDIKWEPKSEFFFTLPTVKKHKYRIKNISVTGQQSGVITGRTQGDGFNIFDPAGIFNKDTVTLAGEASVGKITVTADGTSTGETLLSFAGAAAQTNITVPYADKHEKLIISLKVEGTNPIIFSLNIVFEDAGFKDQESAGENATPSETQYDVKELSYLKSIEVHKSGGFENMAMGADSVEVGQEFVANWWWRTKQDKKRYAIGVREVAAYAYKYNAMAEFVSQPFKTPYPIKKIAISVKESIPDPFLTIGDIDNWIEYYISIDDTTWTRIVPLSRSVTTSYPKFLITAPTTILNSNEISLNSNADVFQTRLRIIMKRPTSGDAIDQYTPIVRDFAIQMFT